MMVVYVPGPGSKFGAMIFVRSPFDGCFGDRTGTMCNWVVPGTWPEWMQSEPSKPTLHIEFGKTATAKSPTIGD